MAADGDYIMVNNNNLIAKKWHHHPKQQLKSRDQPILLAKFLEKQDYESKEQNSGKIGGISQQNQMLYLNE